MANNIIGFLSLHRVNTLEEPSQQTPTQPTWAPLPLTVSFSPPLQQQTHFSVRCRCLATQPSMPIVACCKLHWAVTATSLWSLGDPNAATTNYAAPQVPTDYPITRWFHQTANWDRCQTVQTRPVSHRPPHLTIIIAMGVLPWTSGFWGNCWCTPPCHHFLGLRIDCQQKRQLPRDPKSGFKILFRLYCSNLLLLFFLITLLSFFLCVKYSGIIPSLEYCKVK